MARSAPATPPIPTEGGTYVLDDKTGELVCVQQTQDPMIPTEDNASPDPEAPAAGEV
jgi:hypothetical protein